MSRNEHRPAATRWRGRLARLRVRYDGATGLASRLLGAGVYVAAVATAVCLALYGGFDSSAMDRRILMRMLYGAQALFVAAIVFNLTFRFRATLRDSLWLKRVADMLMLLTIIPVLWPHGSGPVTGVLHFMHSRYFLFSAMGVYALAELSFGTMQLLGRRTNPSLILSVSFLVFILIGSFVLMLPRFTTAPIRYIDALFMASSAVSMTGLCTVDVATRFTPLGWVVMMALMQIGALGVLTFTSFFALFFSGRASIYNQILMRDFVYSKNMGSLMPVILYILMFTLAVEAIGAVGIYLALPDGFGGDTGSRVLFAAFHSVSAFCNAGFSTVPRGMADPALMHGNQAIYLVMSMLIFAGGIGFPNLVNFKDVAVEYGRRLRARLLGLRYTRRTHVYDLNTKLVLIWSLVFLAGGFVAFYVLEYNHSMEGLPTGQRLAQALFCSTTVRTAGFSTYGPASWLGVTLMVAMFLMWVGCASQSMGGGIKVNAFAAVMLNLRAIVRGQRGVVAYRRAVSPASIRRANAVVCISVFAIGAYAALLMLLQPELSGKALAFEAFSAFTTIGMDLGVTTELTDISKGVVITAMFLGRVGIISVLMGLTGNRPDISPMLPADDIVIN